MSKHGEHLILGAHTSIAGGVHNALLEGQNIGATTVQLFTANQRRWEVKPLDREHIELWKHVLKETGLKKIMSHDSYLINLGAPDEANLAKSRKAFREELQRCLDLGITYLNFHPGAGGDKGDPACLECIVDSLLDLEPLLEKGKLRLLLETTAGQGTAVGWRFEQLKHIIEKVKHKIPIGVCIDTCHIFVAGYDIRTPEAWDKTLIEFDKVIGLKHLYAFHVNDSVKPYESRVDRHAQLGEGEIGLESFRFLVTDPRTRELAMYLETPDPAKYAKEIAMLREMSK